MMKWIVAMLLIAAHPAVAQQPPTGERKVYSATNIPHVWDLDERLRIGGTDGAGSYVLWSVVSVLLAEQEIVVGDGGSSELRFFDRASGSHLRTVGGRGGGPGEIDELWSIWRRPGGVAAIDASGRASLFDFSGIFVESVPPPISRLGFRLRRAGFLSDGSALSIRVDRDLEFEAGRATAWMEVVTLEDDQPTVRVRYMHDVELQTNEGRPWGLVFGPVAQVVSFGVGFCLGFPQEYEIGCYDKTGRPLHTISMDGWPRKAVTDQDRRDYFAVNEAANPGPRGRQYRDFLRENAQFATTFPSFGQLLVAENGDLWVGPFVPEGDTPVRRPYPKEPTRWNIFSREGSWKGIVIVPPRAVITDVIGQEVAGISFDQDGVESAVIWIMKSQAPK